MRDRAVWILTLLVVAGCKSSAPGDAREPSHPEEGVPAAHETGEGPGSLRIDPEMLRDLRITTAPAEARAGQELLTILGDLGVNESAYAEVASPVPARVVRLLASPGDPLRAGHALAELESVEIGRTRADYLAAKARAELAATALERKRGLVEERIAPRRELQEAEAEARAAEAVLDAARSALRMLGVPEEGTEPDTRFVLRSPVGGTVIERSAVQGQTADPSHPLYRVGDLSRLWLTAHASERDAVRIRSGTPARVTFAALPGRSFEGTVALVGRQVDAASRTIPVRIDMPNPDGTLRPGMSATASVPLGEAGGAWVAVPATSLQRLQEGWYVFLPQGEGAFEMRSVGRGRDLGEEVEIVSGLRPGEIVVVEGAFLLKAEAEKAGGEGEHHAH